MNKDKGRKLTLLQDIRHLREPPWVELKTWSLRNHAHQSSALFAQNKNEFFIFAMEQAIMPVPGYVSAINGQLYCCETPTSSYKPICIFLQEYFTECHWKKLPISWQAALSKISLQEFCHQMFGIEHHLNCETCPNFFSFNFFLFSS